MATNEPLEERLAGVAALAEPARRALYAFVVAQPDPVSRDEAARGVGVAHHVAKFHLDKLVDEGLLAVEYRRPPGRRGPGAGRPAKLYRRSDREIEVTLPERRYELAGRLLARAIEDSRRGGVALDDALRDAAEAAGRALGEEARRRMGTRPKDDDVVRACLEVLAEHGYEPRDERGGVTLANCPFHGLAQDYTDLVCTMNHELLRAAVERADPEGRARLAAVLDPEPPRCCVRLVREPR